MGDSKEPLWDNLSFSNATFPSLMTAGSQKLSHFILTLYLSDLFWLISSFLKEINLCLPGMQSEWIGVSFHIYKE